jgi:hypothetical protein
MGPRIKEMTTQEKNKLMFRAATKTPIKAVVSRIAFIGRLLTEETFASWLPHRRIWQKL